MRLYYVWNNFTLTKVQTSATDEKTGELLRNYFLKLNDLVLGKLKIGLNFEIILLLILNFIKSKSELYKT